MTISLDVTPYKHVINSWNSIKALYENDMSTFTETNDPLVGQDGFEAVSKRKARRVVLYNEVYCKWFSEKWNLYFESLYNKNINFKITPRSQPYFTPLDCHTHLDMLIPPMLPKPPTVLDLTCGVGGDVIAWLLLNPEKVYCVDYMADEEHEVLNQNLTNFVLAFPDKFPDGVKTIQNANETDGAWEAKISIHQKTASSFLKQYGAHLDRKKKNASQRGEIYEEPCVFMYADPSWNGQYLTDLTNAELQSEKNADANKILDETRQVFGDYEETLENEAIPTILMNYIATCLIKPAIKAKVPIDILCVKVRWEITQEKLQRYLQLNEELKDRFVVLYSVQAIPNVPGRKLKIVGDRYVIVEGKDKKQRKSDVWESTKGMFHWIVLKSVDYTYIHDDRSKLYEEGVIQSHAVYIKKGTYRKPFQTRYSERLSFPSMKTEAQYDSLSETDKKEYTKYGPARTWDDVKLEDVQTYIRKLNDLKSEYDNGDEETRKKTRKKIQKIFELCKTYTETEVSASGKYKPKSRIVQETDEEIKKLKEIVNSIVVNGEWKTVSSRTVPKLRLSSDKTNQTKTTQKGGGSLTSRRSDLDQRTLELLHQLHVIFERE